ncbi:MAG: hypothetical protein WEB85_05300 [Dongiaceae bacterium]
MILAERSEGSMRGTDAGSRALSSYVDIEPGFAGAVKRVVVDPNQCAAPSFGSI